MKLSEFEVRFAPLPTNPWPDTSALDPALQAVYGYLEHVEKALQGRPLCPFVKAVREANGYSLRVTRTCFSPAWSAGDMEPVNLDSVCDQLLADFLERSPAPTVADQLLDTTVSVTAFIDPDAGKEAFCQRLEAARNANRQRFLNRGLMLAHMTPQHADPKGTQSYNPASVSLLMVRRMHREDHVLMKKPSERAAYERFFGTPPQGWPAER